MNNSHKLVCGIGVATLVWLSIAHAWHKDVQTPNCPGTSPAVTWRDYISGKSGIPARYLGNVFGVEFRVAKKVNDPGAIGNLPTNACYEIIYIPVSKLKHPVGYLSNRLWPQGKEPGRPDLQEGLPGDPNRYQINVHGVKLLFNDHGEVLDHRGRPVGTLMCYTSNECGDY